MMPSAEARLLVAAALVCASLIGCGAGTEPVEPIKAEPGKTRAELQTGRGPRKADGKDARLAGPH